jgi:hypothetical protein
VFVPHTRARYTGPGGGSVSFLDIVARAKASWSAIIGCR